MPVQTAQEYHHHQSMFEVEMEDHQIDGVAGVAETPRMNKLEFDENDEKIINATLKAFESGTLTPLIKEELRCTIQSRRIAEGKGEMKVEFKTPARKKEMNDDERKKALKRRQQNREAAQRFRQKQKDTSDYLTVKIKKLEKSADALTKQMDSLREEKELLGQMFRDHLAVCANPHITDNSTIFDNNNDITNTTTTMTTDARQIHSSSLDSQTSFFSTSSMDSNMTCAFTPNTAASDSSVFFHDDNNIIQSPQHDSTTTSINTDEEIDPFDLQALPSSTASFEDFENNKCSPFPSNFNTAENVIVYDGPLDACYEEIIIDISAVGADDLLNVDGRTRGDSCSSVDTVSSWYSSTAGSELPVISETPTDLHCNSTIISTPYSGIHNIIDSSYDSTHCDKNAVHITNDFLLLDNEDL